MTAIEYVEANNEVDTCATFEVSENWRQELLEMVVSNGHQSKRADVATRIQMKKVMKNFLEVQLPHTLKQSNLAMTC